MQATRIGTGLYEVATTAGVFELVRRIDIDGLWYVTNPGCARPDGSFATKRDAIAAITFMLANPTMYGI